MCESYNLAGVTSRFKFRGKPDFTTINALQCHFKPNLQRFVVNSILTITMVTWREGPHRKFATNRCKIKRSSTGKFTPPSEPRLQSLQICNVVANLASAGGCPYTPPQFAKVVLSVNDGTIYPNPNFFFGLRLSVRQLGGCKGVWFWPF